MESQTPAISSQAAATSLRLRRYALACDEYRLKVVLDPGRDEEAYDDHEDDEY